MKLYNSLRIAFSLSILSFYGCGGAGITNTITFMPTLTGNWVMSVEVPDPGKLDQNGNITYITRNSWAFLSQDGTSVSGTVEDNSCYPSQATFPVTGSLIGGQLTLIPTFKLPLEFGNFSLNATVSANLTTFQGETMKNSCGLPPVPLPLTTTGQQVASFAGTWTGTLTSVSGPSATIAATITEAGPDGTEFPSLSGNVTISGSPCFTAGTLAGNQIGNSLSATITTTNGTIEIPEIGSGGAFLNSGDQLSVSYSVQGGTCNGDYAQGTLTTQ
jgi:hypothetical protein